MDSEQRRKRKQLAKRLLPLKFLVLCCCSVLVFLLYVSSDRFSVPSSKLRPALAFPADVSLLTSVVDSVKDLDDEEFRMMRIEGRVLFPDHIMLLISGARRLREVRHCVYYRLVNHTFYNGNKEIAIRPVLSMDEYDDFRSIIRCPLPPLDHSAEVDLWRNEMEQVEEDGGNGHNQSAHSWEIVAYEAALDGETVVVFVKGLNLRQGRVADPTHLSCHFGLGELDRNETFVLTTKAISAAQEAVRCALPRSIKNNLDKAQSVRVAIGVDQICHGRNMNDGRGLDRKWM